MLLLLFAYNNKTHLFENNEMRLSVDHGLCLVVGVVEHDPGDPDTLLLGRRQGVERLVVLKLIF